MYNKIYMKKLTFEKKRRFRVVAISDSPVPTYRLELEMSFEDDPNEISKSWINELLIYNWDFSKLLRMLCLYLEIDSIKYDFFEDERRWIYLEN